MMRFNEHTFYLVKYSCERNEGEAGEGEEGLPTACILTPCDKEGGKGV